MVIIDGFDYVSLYNKMVYDLGLLDDIDKSHAISKAFHDLCDKFNAYREELKAHPLERAHAFKYKPEALTKLAEPTITLTDYEQEIIDQISSMIPGKTIDKLLVAHPNGTYKLCGNEEIAFPIVYVGVVDDYRY